MIKVVKHREIEDNNKEYFKVNCKCGAEFVFNSDDISSTRMIPPTHWVTCPECYASIYLSSKYTNRGIITSISEEEYNEYIKEE